MSGSDLEEPELNEISEQSDSNEEEVLGDEELSKLKTPPSKGNLERETGKLKSKYKILRKALIEEKLGQVNKEIDDIETGRAPELAKDLADIDNRNAHAVRVAEERRRLKAESILAEYKAAEDELYKLIRNDDKRPTEQTEAGDISSRPPRMPAKRGGKKKRERLEKLKKDIDQEHQFSRKKPKKDKKERDPNEPKPVPKTLESKRIFTEGQLMNEEKLEKMDATDEFARFFVDGEEPKILITTSRRAHPSTHLFAEELSDLFPSAEYKKRPSDMLISDVVKGAVERDYTHMLVVNESKKEPDTLSMVKLPEGPTAIFQLTSIKLSKQIHNHGRSSSHTPELILNNFVTELGHRVGRLFVSLFPHVPQFQGRQVVTFHNQRDFIFVRRHRYIFEDGKRVRLQEIGPQFTLKLHKIFKATHNLKDAEQEYQWKSHAVNNKVFAL